MKRTQNIWVLAFVICFLSCDKFEQVISSAAAAEISRQVEEKTGMYIGVTNEYAKVGGNGYDSTVTNIFYPDTFFVSLMSDSRISFIRQGSQRGWDYDIVNDHIYGQHFGRSNDLFDLSGQDSLYVQFWSAGGFGAGASSRYDRFAGELVR